MPLYLRPPKAGRSPYWHVRGTYLGQHIERSTGAIKRSVALKILKNIEIEIERGASAESQGPTFAAAALNYMRAGRDRRWLYQLIECFGETPISRIDQTAIDSAAGKLFPNATAATRNRQVYSPVSAVLKYAGVNFALKRPKGADGRILSSWLWPEEAQRLFQEINKIDRELHALCVLLCYTGLRLGEALRLQCDDLRLTESYAYVGKTKNGDPRGVFLPSFVVTTLANHPRGLDRKERVFRFTKSGKLYLMLRSAAATAAVKLPERSAYHIFRHTYATWMRRYAGVDLQGLVSTGAWKSAKSASRYAHTVSTEESQAAERLPVGKLRAIDQQS